jgi:hypothetical protein
MGNQMVSVKEAAAALGVDAKTIRRRIKTRELHAETVQIPGGFAYRVAVPIPESPPLAQTVSAPSPTVQALLDVMREKDRQIASLQAERLSMAGQLGAFTERIQTLQHQVLMLEAPRPEPASDKPWPWWAFWRRG